MGKDKIPFGSIQLDLLQRWPNRQQRFIKHHDAAWRILRREIEIKIAG